MNVVLIGFRGSGKSTVGQRLGEKLKREFIDCDDFIEKRTHLTIREIFERHGESHFRTLESEAIAELAKLDGKVLATGGGAVLKYQNMQVFKRAGATIFFLDVSPEIAFDRIQSDPATRARRPALTDKDPATEIREQITLRLPYYRQAADQIVAVDGRTVEDVVNDIVRHLQGPGPEERETAPIA
jgi:shikimate kinase